MEVRVRHGIKLYRRVCPVCKLVDFWVPRSSPQKFCSVECRDGAGGKKWSATYIRKKRNVDYLLTEDDYEEID